MKTVMNPQVSYLPLPQIKNQLPAQPGVFKQIAAQATSADISFTTKEGDRVNLKQLSATQHAQAQSIATDTGVMSQYANATSANGFSIQVEGDLNEQELADLALLLEELGGIADNFFQGNMTTAIEDAMNIGDMGTIAQLEARFTRTTVLSTYLSGPHPLPAIEASLLAGFPEYRLDENDDYRVADALKAQWQQFLDYLNHQDEGPPEVKENNSRPASPLPAINGKQTGEALLARSLETLEKNPRLTPLIPSVASLALQQAMPLTQGQGWPQAEEVMNSFHNAFNRWAA